MYASPGFDVDTATPHQMALWLAERDIPVFPLHSPVGLNGCSCGKSFCESQGKHPRTQNGFKDATTDRQRIDDWWLYWPKANLGMPTGDRSGILVLDLDPRNGAPSRDEFEGEYGPIPDGTPEVITGSGGRHIYSAYDPRLFQNIRIPAQLGPGIDIKSNGGYVVVPPSMHSNGNPYRFDGEKPLARLTTPPSLPWFVERIQEVSRKIVPISQNERKWVPGERNNQLASLAGYLRRGGWSQQDIEAHLLLANQKRCEPPLSKGEVMAIAESVARYSIGEAPIGHTGLNGNQRQPAALEPLESDQLFDLDTLASPRDICAQKTAFVVEGLIPDGAITAITSESGAGKSFFTLALAGAVSSGSDFLGREVLQRKVLVLDNENPGSTIVERMDALHIADTDLKILFGSQACGMFPPDSPEVLAWVAKCNPKPLIIVDTLISFIEGSENDASDMQAFMRKLRDLAHQGCAVIVLHHTGKADTSKTYRGSSYFAGGIDIGISLSNPEQGGPLRRLFLKPFKERFQVKADLLVNYEAGHFFVEQHRQAKQIVETDVMTAVLRDNPWVNTERFAKLCRERGIGRNESRHFLSVGVRMDTVQTKPGDRNAILHALKD